MADWQVKLGNQLLDVWKLKDSAKAFEDALKANPYNNAAAFGLYKTKMFEKAASGEYDPEVSEQRLKLVLDLNENDPHAQASLGDYFSRRNDWEKAREHYHSAIEQRKTLKQPQFAHALFGLGTVELDTRNYAAAVEALSEAAKLSPLNWEYLDNLAFAQSQSGQIKEALETYNALNSLQSRLILPYLERARLHLQQQGDLENGRAFLERTAHLIDNKDIAKDADNNADWFFPAGEESVYLTDLDHKRAYVHGSRAAISYVIGEEEKARQAARLVPKLSKEDITSVTRLIRYDLALLVQRRGDLVTRVQQFDGWWRQRLARR